jgi:hypothetical protein
MDRRAPSTGNRASARIRQAEKKLLAHREGRTRSLQITQLCELLHACCKSLTLYPIELGGRYQCFSSNIYNTSLPDLIEVICPLLPSQEGRHVIIHLSPGLARAGVKR